MGTKKRKINYKRFIPFLIFVILIFFGMIKISKNAITKISEINKKDSYENIKKNNIIVSNNGHHNIYIYILW